MRGRRRVVGLDRTLLTVLGLVLVAGGAFVVAAGAGWLSAVVPEGTTLDLSAAGQAFDAKWWTGACAAVAVALVAFGLWWVLAHRPGPRTSTLGLSGSRTGDRLRIAPDAATRAASSVLESDPQVRSATLVLREERGVLVLVGRVGVGPRADVPAVAALVDDTARRTGQVLGRDVSGRVHLAIARRDTRERRVG